MARVQVTGNDGRICPRCKREGLKSSVGAEVDPQEHYGFGVTDAWWNEHGEYRLEREGFTATGYVCSKGHRWTEVVEWGDNLFVVPGSDADIYEGTVWV